MWGSHNEALYKSTFTFTYGFSVLGKGDKPPPPPPPTLHWSTTASLPLSELAVNKLQEYLWTGSPTTYTGRMKTEVTLLWAGWTAATAVYFSLDWLDQSPSMSTRSLGLYHAAFTPDTCSPDPDTHLYPLSPSTIYMYPVSATKLSSWLHVSTCIRE